jgi:1-deoxy-D-xylulose-5-phosphate reductoisomerase
VSVAGSTGSIGTQTLEVVAAEPDRFEVVGLGAHRSVDALVQQVRRWRPQVVAVTDPDAGAEVSRLVPPGTDVVTGPDALEALGCCGDVVVNGIVGFAGLDVTLAALRSGRRLALANKESLIAAGPVVRTALAEGGGVIVPVDSEHCALHQCLRAGHADEVDRLVLTASGGPFRGRTADELAGVTVDDALAHPTWDMGPKITVDSSTLMNKGLEVIEATELFGVAPHQVEVVVHPQSIVHSLVVFKDGASVAQLSRPDMRLCIGYALGHPDRLHTTFGDVDLADVGRLDFEPPDRATFRCLDLAYAAAEEGGSAPAWLNAANEVAVAAFLGGTVRWLEIAEVVADALSAHTGTRLDSTEAVIDVDRRARLVAQAIVSRRAA